MGNELAKERSISERLEYLIWVVAAERPYHRGRFDGMDHRQLTVALERWYAFVCKHPSPHSGNQRERNTILREFNEMAEYDTPAGSALFQLVADYGANLRYHRSDQFADYSIEELKTAYEDAAYWKTVYGIISEILTYGAPLLTQAPAVGARLLAAMNAARTAAVVSRAAGPASWVVYGASVAATLAANRLYAGYMSRIEFEIEGNRIHNGEITAQEWEAFEDPINDEFDDYSVVD